MYISCDCSVDLGEYPDFSEARIVKARKSHVCCECQEEIAPGQKYEIIVGKWEDEFRSFKTCIGCRNLRNHLCYYGYELGGLAHQIYECIGFDYREEPTNLEEEEEC